MATTANADKCEIVCAPVEVTNVIGKDELKTEREGRFTIQEGQNEQEIKLSKGKLTKEFVNAKSYAKTIKKQKSYKTNSRKEAGKNGTER